MQEQSPHSSWQLLSRVKRWPWPLPAASGAPWGVGGGLPLVLLCTAASSSSQMFWHSCHWAGKHHLIPGLYLDHLKQWSSGKADPGSCLFLPERSTICGCTTPVSPLFPQAADTDQPSSTGGNYLPMSLTVGAPLLPSPVMCPPQAPRWARMPTDHRWKPDRQPFLAS